MLTKKSWEKPQLVAYGDVEALTNVNANDLQRIGKIIEGSVGLFASLEGL
jgi:hypothetical protein